jgi:hypothetical protein
MFKIRQKRTLVGFGTDLKILLHVLLIISTIYLLAVLGFELRVSGLDMSHSPALFGVGYF